jgi:hypothetical protein
LTSSGIESESAEVKKGIVPCELCECTRKKYFCKNWLIKMKWEETTPDNLTFQTSALKYGLNT